MKKYACILVWLQGQAGGSPRENLPLKPYNVESRLRLCRESALAVALNQRRGERMLRNMQQLLRIRLTNHATMRLSSSQPLGMLPMPRIVVIGALVYDFVFEVPDWVTPNRAVHATAATMTPGGKALNQAAAAALLGAEDARLVGCVGQDMLGDAMLAALNEVGVNTRHVRRHREARTSIASIVVKDGVPGFIGAPEASRLVDEEQLQGALADLDAGDIVLVDFEIPQPLVQFALERARTAGAVTVLNPAPFFTRDSFVVGYLHLVDVLIPNKLEAQLILGSESEDLEFLARELLALGVKQVVLTIGELGSVLVEAACQLEQPAFALDIVDTTGASDAFVGAYCQGLALGWPTARTLEFASAAAGLACTKPGTMSSLPSLNEVQAFLAVAPS